MSCCGSQRAALRQESAQPSPGEPGYWTSAPIEFEYSGSSQLTVTGPLTGVVYHFASHGARVLVQGADAPSLLSVPGLKPVRAV
jgi:hypothetical protein